MQAAALSAAVVLLFVPLAVAEPQPQLALSFHSPAQVAGAGAASNLTWGLFLFPTGALAEVHALFPGGARYTGQRVAQVGVTNDVVGTTYTQGLPDRPEELPGPLDVLLRFGEAHGSLFIQASNVTLSWAGVQGEVKAVDGSPDVDLLLPELEGYGQVHRNAWFAPAGSVALAAVRPQRLVIQAEGVRAIEWHNATTSCASQPCPDGAPSYGSGSPAGASAFVHGYGLLEGEGGEARGQGESPAWAAGGQRIALAVQDARLPAARLSAPCDTACPRLSGETLRVQGNVTLADLQAQGGDLQSRLEGSPGLFKLDERVVPASAFGWTATAGVVGVAIAVPLLFRLATLLFSRFHRSEDVLEHPRRKALYQLIRATPGLSYAELRAASGLSNGALQNHLRQLRQHGWVVGRPHLNRVRFFENHGLHDASWRSTATLMDEPVRRLHDLVRASPGAAQVELARHAKDAWGWSPSATRKRLARLAEAGLVEASRSAGRLRYAVRDPAA